MSRPSKYPDELRERGVRLVFENGWPIAHVARDLGVHRETLRLWSAGPRLMVAVAAIA